MVCVCTRTCVLYCSVWTDERTKKQRIDVEEVEKESLAKTEPRTKSLTSRGRIDGKEPDLREQNEWRKQKIRTKTQPS